MRHRGRQHLRQHQRPPNMITLLRPIMDHLSTAFLSFDLVWHFLNSRFSCHSDFREFLDLQSMIFLILFHFSPFRLQIANTRPITSDGLRTSNYLTNTTKHHPTPTHSRTHSLTYTHTHTLTYTLRNRRRILSGRKAFVFFFFVFL